MYTVHYCDLKVLLYFSTPPSQNIEIFLRSKSNCVSLLRLSFTRTLREEYISGELDHVKRSIFLLYCIQVIKIWKIRHLNASVVKQVYFTPEEVNACIVTCGGLCPGLNTVIREIVHSLDYMYGATKVLGIDVSQ